MNTKKNISIKKLLVGMLIILLMIGCLYASKEQIEEMEARERAVQELRREVRGAEKTLSTLEQGESIAEETIAEKGTEELLTSGSACKKMKLNPSEADAIIKELSEEEEILKEKLADLEAGIDARRTDVPALAEKTEEAGTEKAVNDEKFDEKIDQLLSYKVKKGDYLSKIAERSEIYGHGKYARWIEIYNANRDKIKNPDLILPGQNLVIPRP
jgi:chromosome segregation ATPase